MRKLIALSATAAATLALAVPAFAQQYEPAPYVEGPAVYGYTYQSQSNLDNGRYTASDIDGGTMTYGRARPDPAVGNNVSRGTDARGTVDPPARDRDVNDAFKSIN